MSAAAFKPTRSEVKRAQYLAAECEIDLCATASLAAQGRNSWYGMHRPAERSAQAFALAIDVARRSQAVQS